MDIISSFFAGLDISNPFQAMWFVFSHGGWIVVAIFAIRGFWDMWLLEIRGHYWGTIDYVVLAINVPKQTEQTPKAVENVFAHLTGLYSGFGNLIDKYWKGKVQESFSVELISRGGFIQYCVRIPVKYRDVLESAIFAQYPDAEVNEIPDYTSEYPQTWPDETYDMWGSEIGLSKSGEYPIRTYPSFYDQISQTFKDPLASMLEFLGTLRPREAVLVQFILLPTTDDWHKKSQETVKKLIGARVAAPPKKAYITLLHGIATAVLWPIEHLFGIPSVLQTSAKADPAAPPSIMQHLSPGERSVVEQIQVKASKPGYLVKIRIICLAPKEIMNKQRMVGGIMGAFKQFNTLDMNSFKPDPYTITRANYFRVQQRLQARMRKVWTNYRFRSGRGGPFNMFNVEELATLWHFPMIDVKAPLVSKAEVKRAEPPAHLPMPEERVMRAPGKVVEMPPSVEDSGDIDTPPSNIPFV